MAPNGHAAIIGCESREALPANIAENSVSPYSEDEMKLKLWQVDAFAERPFAGNPAAVVPLNGWLSDAKMQAIANENNLAETAFFVPNATGMGRYDLRWFTPAVEVPLC